MAKREAASHFISLHCMKLLFLCRIQIFLDFPHESRIKFDKSFPESISKSIALHFCCLSCAKPCSLFSNWSEKYCGAGLSLEFNLIFYYW